MAEIKVLKGLRYTPEMFLKRMAKSRKLKNTITVRHVNTLYSLCWISVAYTHLDVYKRQDQFCMFLCH